ncbi:restriction endonuclease subunit S [Acerihabitans arboris]|uniref:Restriction endonuclease subunit S n=1 Tax=Acerihabitans arboris TaxID=2691583 RepID=A0A845SM47_9GAMM|nr:restriction endonuclease subunit S [Acerihabitans arboris]NDL65069.1 restriction endonuclease subunit S [Acerihabitans arboris]
MSERKLPKGWVDTQLGKIVNYGKANKQILSDVHPDTWVLELEDIEKNSSKLLNQVRVTDRPFKSTKNSFKNGDVLYGKLRPYLNKVIVAKEDGVCTTEIIPINAEPFCFNKYIFYWLKNSIFLSYVDEVSYGVNMPRLGTTDGLNAPFRLAPLAEQKIIAEKLDTLLAQVDSARARLEKIPQILKRFRQAVLAASVSGKLTEDWRGQVKLINWKNGILKEFIKKPTYGTSAKSQKEGLIPVLRMGNLQGGSLDWTDLAYTSDPVEIKKYKLEPKDILFNRTNSPELVGKTSIYNSENPAIYAGYLIRIQCLPELNPEFLNYHLNSHLAKQYCYSVKTDGVSQSNINAQKLAAYPLNVPPLIEQLEIVRRVEQLFAYANAIEKQVNNALSRVNNLTLSILAKAFRGELTVQWREENPELISGENSAAVLLENIKAERAASGRKRVLRKKT